MEYTYLSLEQFYDNRRDKSSEKRKILNNTWVKKGKFMFPLTGEMIPDCMIVQLHDSDILGYTSDNLPYNNNQIMINSWGYLTPTTKNRINEFIPYPFYVYQNAHIWYLFNSTSKISYPFQDGITINLIDNQVYFYKDISDLNQEKILIKQVKKYCKEYTRLFISGKMNKPDNGDCLYCLMNFPDNGKDHLLLHLEESYYVPSLLIKALNFPNIQVSPIVNSFIYNQWYTEKREDYHMFNDLAYNQIFKAIEKYILTCLNLVR